MAYWFAGSFYRARYTERQERRNSIVLDVKGIEMSTQPGSRARPAQSDAAFGRRPTDALTRPASVSLDSRCKLQKRGPP